jgi:hypothetical protein
MFHKTSTLIQVTEKKVEEILALIEALDAKTGDQQ